MRYSAQVKPITHLKAHAQVTTTQCYLDHLALEDFRGAVPDLLTF